MNVIQLEDQTLKQINQVQYEVILKQREEIDALKRQIQHLESLLFSRAILLTDKKTE